VLPPSTSNASARAAIELVSRQVNIAQEVTSDATIMARRSPSLLASQAAGTSPRIVPMPMAESMRAATAVEAPASRATRAMIGMMAPVPIS
jgi:hypothetical protein